MGDFLWRVSLLKWKEMLAWFWISQSSEWGWLGCGQGGGWQLEEQTMVWHWGRTRKKIDGFSVQSLRATWQVASLARHFPPLHPPLHSGSHPLCWKETPEFSPCSWTTGSESHTSPCPPSCFEFSQSLNSLIIYGLFFCFWPHLALWTWRFDRASLFVLSHYWLRSTSLLVRHCTNQGATALPLLPFLVPRMGLRWRSPSGVLE